ncbi:PREDICTED: centromere protein S-like [Priapulus caudatus]|uniref:Centromere protein S n=1 Tax=Priapulus caudatus TaxID=37621 RepID=A0ABM1DP93_PRICU|nr:PREDICTED: centromere protein S-like [Priapulus caudatus]
MDGHDVQGRLRVSCLSQRLKAAFHYTVGKICEKFAEENDVTFTRKLLPLFSEAVCQQAQSFAVDLELFANHAKRTTINADDVKLLVRKNPDLLDRINGLCDAETATNEMLRENKKSKQRKTKKPSAPTAISDESNNADS